MARDVTLQATMSELVGDETYELWLKHGTDAWALLATGDVDVDGSSHQDFLLHALTAGDNYVAQLRLKRAGRYRVGYLTSNPDSWPSGSRCAFVPGALVGIGAPVIIDGAWARTGAMATNITLTIDPDDTAKDLKIFRDGVEVGTIVHPLTSPQTYVDNNPSVGVEHVYTAKHTVGFLDGPASAPFGVFAGPPVPASVTRTSADDNYGTYTLTWVAGTDPVRVQDDFICNELAWANEVIGGGGVTTAETITVTVEHTDTPPGATQSADFHARVRREVESFTVTDVSDWVEIAVIMVIDDPNTTYHSCP